MRLQNLTNWTPLSSPSPLWSTGNIESWKALNRVNVALAILGFCRNMAVCSSLPSLIRVWYYTISNMLAYLTLIIFTNHCVDEDNDPVKIFSSRLDLAADPGLPSLLFIHLAATCPLYFCMLFCISYILYYFNGVDNKVDLSMYLSIWVHVESRFFHKVYFGRSTAETSYWQWLCNWCTCHRTDIYMMWHWQVLFCLCCCKSSNTSWWCEVNINK